VNKTIMIGRKRENKGNKSSERQMNEEEERVIKGIWHLGRKGIKCNTNKMKELGNT
jgi:hypothetical protein